MLLRIKSIHLKKYLISNKFATSQQNIAQKGSNEASPKKASNYSFLKYELSENPEFDKAFPHLASNKPQTKITQDKEEKEFISSLLHQARVNPEKTYEETLQENYKKYVEGYKSPKGPIRWMSEEEKEKIHTLIDTKLQELEDTGLSREELLYDGKTGGLPLARDPFFLFLKKNRLAREMLLKPGEEFNVQKVIDLALKQDIGPDPALSRRKKHYLYDHEIDDQTRLDFAKGVVHDKSVFRSDNYFSAYQQNALQHEELVDTNVKKHPFPKTRSQLKREIFRPIDWLDVHWRNTEFLTKFMNPAGKIKNHYQTRLPKVQQKKISRVIKHARHIRTIVMLPYVGFIKPTDKKSLRTLQEDLEDFAKRKINIETGQIYLDGGEKSKSEDPFETNDPTEFDEEGFEHIRDLELEFLPIMPTADEVKILEAQHQANKIKVEDLKKQGVNVDRLNQAKHDKLHSNKLFDPKTAEEETAESAQTFQESYTEFERSVENIPSSKIVEAFLAEKAVNPSYLNTLNKKSDIASQKNTREEVLREIESVKKELGL